MHKFSQSLKYILLTGREEPGVLRIGYAGRCLDQVGARHEGRDGFVDHEQYMRADRSTSSEESTAQQVGVPDKRGKQ